MRSRIKPRLTYANVMVSILAVLVVGGGGAYAAKKLKLKNNSVTTPKIANGAVTTPKIGDQATTSAKLADGAVTQAKLGNSAVTNAKLADGAVLSEKLGDGSVTQAKLSTDARSYVVAFGRVDNGAGAPALSDSRGLTGVSQLLTDGEGATRVSVDANALPGNQSTSDCSVQATPAFNAINGTLGAALVSVAVGSPNAPNQVQVQTRAFNGDPFDAGYYIEVACQHLAL